MSMVTKAQLKRIKKLAIDLLEQQLEAAKADRLVKLNEDFCPDEDGTVYTKVLPRDLLPTTLKMLKDFNESMHDETAEKTFKGLADRARAAGRSFENDATELAEQASHLRN